MTNKKTIGTVVAVHRFSRSPFFLSPSATASVTSKMTVRREARVGPAMQPGRRCVRCLPLPLPPFFFFPRRPFFPFLEDQAAVVEFKRAKKLPRRGPVATPFFPSSSRGLLLSFPGPGTTAAKPKERSLTTWPSSSPFPPSLPPVFFLPAPLGRHW